MKKIILVLAFSFFSFAFSFGQWDSVANGIKGGGPFTSTYGWTQTVYNGKLYFGGQFDTAGDVPEYSLGEWNGVNWSIFSTTDSGSLVASMIVYNGNLIAAGRFGKIDGVPYTNIAQWNGSSWSSLAGGIPGAFYVAAMAVYNGNLYAAGVFSLSGGYNIAMWNGSAWSPLGKGVYNKQIGNFKTGGGIFALCVYNGKLYAGGKFDSAGGIAATNIATWDGANWAPVGTGLKDSTIGAFTVFNNELYTGGFIGTYNNSLGIIDVWNGTSWSSVGNGFTGTRYSGTKVFALCVYDNAVCAGGRFDTISGIAANDIAYWDGTNWGTLGNGIYGAVNTLGVYNSELYAAGGFGYAGNINVNNVAVWSGPLGVNNMQENMQYVKFYPNPNNGIFTIQLANSQQLIPARAGSDGANSSIGIYNMLGEEVYTTKLNATNTQIDLSGKSPGVYLYRVTSENGEPVSQGKFIIH